ncbi:hypothetical protein BGZ65_007909 [Modicella reniformis]|uniref:Uncharacterized protein n=1 Tax=Modicella reniformis TaxID=1440133 RepID=A0A9P6MFB0_9FUNG|nr:hypothetical protein BGZ65_007909 [Modicella reniformis]
MSSTKQTPINQTKPPAPQTDTDQQNDSQVQEQEQHKPMMALPAPGDVSSSSSDNAQLEVNGRDLKLDYLGPIVVNENGTMSRIDNWHEMAEIERANVRRILLKRNAQRLERLRAAQAQADDGAGSGSVGTEGSTASDKK